MPASSLTFLLLLAISEVRNFGHSLGSPMGFQGNMVARVDPGEWKELAGMGASVGMAGVSSCGADAAV